MPRNESITIFDQFNSILGHAFTKNFDEMLREKIEEKKAEMKAKESELFDDEEIFDE